MLHYDSLCASYLSKGANRRGRTEEKKEGRVWLPREIKEFRKVAETRASQRRHLSPAGSERVAGKQSNLRGKTSRIKRDVGAQSWRDKWNTSSE